MAESRLLSVIFGLSVSIAPGDDGRPVQSDAWVYDQIEHANVLFAPAGVAFRWVRERTGVARANHVETRADRDALGDSFDARVVNVTVVGSLRDVDEPARMRMGVCWQRGDDTAHRYLLVSSIARPTVLAHELGHFFGNAHTTVPNNLMSYVRTDPDAVAFNPTQLATIRARAAGALAEQTLLEQPPARTWP